MMAETENIRQGRHLVPRRASQAQSNDSPYHIGRVDSGKAGPTKNEWALLAANPELAFSYSGKLLRRKLLEACAEIVRLRKLTGEA